MKFILEQSDETLVTHSGLSIVGLLLSKIQLKNRLNATALPDVDKPEISHGDVVTSYIGLLCQGKSDYDCIEQFRGDTFFSHALDLEAIPSSQTLRQRLDMSGKYEQWCSIIIEESLNLISASNAQVTAIPTEDDRHHVPLDIDVSPFDNSNTKKEGVSHTYKGVDGYAPIFAYLGAKGYAINVELMEGKVHCPKGYTPFLSPKH